MGKIEESDPQERRRSRIVHWIGSALFVCILLAALAGLVGKGPLSKVTIAAPSGALQVEHQRFVRHHAPTEIKIQVDKAGTATGLVRLHLSKSFIEKTELKQITPQPEHARTGPDFFTYDIRVETNATVDLRVSFQPNHFGGHSFLLKINDGDPIPLEHFAYP